MANTRVTEVFANVIYDRSNTMRVTENFAAIAYDRGNFLRVTEIFCVTAAPAVVVDQPQQVVNIG